MEFRPGLESFSISYDVSLEITLIELPNLDNYRQLDTSLKSGTLYISSFSWFTQRKSWLTYKHLFHYSSGSSNMHGLTVF